MESALVAPLCQFALCALEVFLSLGFHAGSFCSHDVDPVGKLLNSSFKLAFELVSGPWISQGTLRQLFRGKAILLHFSCERGIYVRYHLLVDDISGNRRTVKRLMAFPAII